MARWRSWGLENIPSNEPVIFAPNHQNALMDALIVLFSAPGDVVFLARADIFNKRFLAFLLNSLKILPVFRQRDGASELGKNVDIFDISVNVLKNRHYLCVMPEGNHGHQRKLRPLVKGIFRIAFQAQEKEGSEPFVKIIPVGLDFGDYVKQNASLYINYGKPIEVSEYWEQFQENSARAINALKSRLGEELSPLMIDIQNEEHYEAIYVLKGIFNKAMRNELGITGTRLSDRFKADKELIRRVESLMENKAGSSGDEEDKKTTEEIDALMARVSLYDAGVKKLKIRDWVVEERGIGPVRTALRYLGLLFTFPFSLWPGKQCPALFSSCPDGAQDQGQAVPCLCEGRTGDPDPLPPDPWPADPAGGDLYRTLVDLGALYVLALPPGKSGPLVVRALEKNSAGSLVQQAAAPPEARSLGTGGVKKRDYRGDRPAGSLMPRFPVS